MPINASKARALCTATEYNLFKWSSAKMSKTLTPARLKQKIDRARKLRNKYRDLAKQQRGEARGKRKPTGTRAAKGNERTVEKAQLFEEVIDRFEKALKAANAADKAETKKTARATSSGKTKSKPTKTKSTKKKATKKKAAKKKAAATSSVKKKSPSTGAKKKTKKATKRPAAAVPLAAGGASVAKPTLGGRAAHESPFGKLVESTGKSDIEARRTRRQQTSRAAKAGRIESRFARTVQEKIHGHVSGQTKRNQARRDTKN